VKFNDRQRLVTNRLLEGFEGKLTTFKYAALAKCSQDTAHRDILDLVEQSVLVQNPEGRSVLRRMIRRDLYRLRVL
jgi:Fic family protein